MIQIKNFFVDTTKGIDVVPITHDLRRMLREVGTEAGWVAAMSPFPGAGMVIVEAESPKAEIKKGLEPLLANQLIRCLLPKSVFVPVEKGRLMIDPWQEVFLIDYETMGRRREFRVQIYGEQKEATNEFES